MNILQETIKEADNAPANVAYTEAEAGRLRSFIERIERLEEEKKNISSDITEVYAEAKGQGFDPKIMRAIVKIRKMPPPQREEQDYLIELYKQHLGIE